MINNINNNISVVSSDSRFVIIPIIHSCRNDLHKCHTYRYMPKVIIQKFEIIFCPANYCRQPTDEAIGSMH